MLERERVDQLTRHSDFIARRHVGKWIRLGQQLPRVVEFAIVARRVGLHDELTRTPRISRHPRAVP